MLSGGFLLTSCVMVTKAPTLPSGKDFIIAASGVTDEQWKGTYTKETGGILTLKFKLGELIHRVATCGVLTIAFLAGSGEVC